MIAEKWFLRNNCAKWLHKMEMKITVQGYTTGVEVNVNVSIFQIILDLETARDQTPIRQTIYYAFGAWLKPLLGSLALN